MMKILFALAIFAHIFCAISAMHPQFKSRCLSSLRAVKSKKIDTSAQHSESGENADIVAAMLPGDPYVTGTLTQGVINGISIYNNILLAR